MTATYRFGRFDLNPATREIWVDNQPAPLGARAFDVLLALIERRDRLVTKNELLDLVWPGLVVEENNLQVQISALRKLLGADAIATVATRGYRFTRDVVVIGHGADSTTQTAQVSTASPRTASVGVMPFAAFSEDVALERRATMVTRDFASMLVRTGSFMSVIPVVSERAFAVRYLVEGDLRHHEGDDIVISIRLFDMATSGQVWSESTILIASRDANANARSLDAVAWRLMRAVVSAETRRLAAEPQIDLTPVDLAMLALSLDRTEEDVDQRIRKKRALLEDALSRDPNCVPALLGLALTFDLQLAHDIDVDRDALVRLMAEATAKAVRLNDGMPSAWALHSAALLYAGRWEAALEASAKTLVLEPYGCAPLANQAWLVLMCGRPMDALTTIELVLAMDKQHTGTQMQVLCEANLLLGQYQRATEAGERSLGLGAYDESAIRVMLAAAYMHIGNTAESVAMRDAVLKLQPRHTIAVDRARRCSRHTQYLELLEEHVYPALRRARWPED